MRTKLLCFIAACLIAQLTPSMAIADELKPAFLQIQQKEVDLWSVYWKVSYPSTLSRIAKLEFPENCETVGESSVLVEQARRIEAIDLRCQPSDLEGNIKINGLANTNTDVLVRQISLSGETSTQRLTASNDQFAFAENAQQSTSPFLGYLVLGFEHILEGLDHVFFVIGMVLLIQSWRLLFWTITAFTFAHSLTLIGVTLSWFSLSQKPVEAIIALSIIFLAVEILKSDPDQRNLSTTAPWLVALIFGLLHGFGFAGALAEIGLPKQDVVLALFSFNLGVEVGQLLVVGIMLGFLKICQLLHTKLESGARIAFAYSIGGIASYWFLQRVIV